METPSCPPASTLLFSFNVPLTDLIASPKAEMFQTSVTDLKASPVSLNASQVFYSL